ncbi:DUF3833 family protein [Sphingomonas sp.]|uniref:DUF3833 family protein n=1 Tax=Sphingomonas sp. TaxID=28214 RepID=UPI001AFF1645|nr:DUF3833 family protein [Sphingomonas sp.]MBO9714915.1 DUF3833 family protein [Sphingomonas sp.]
MQQTAPSAAFEQFFVGVTEGAGTVDVAILGKHNMRDRGHGRLDASGALVLEQTVEEQGKPARKRSWRLVRSGARITGTISDASGPVSGDVSGPTLHLRYRLAEGPSVEQWITLHPSGRSATNRMSFRRFGFKVATVESVIRKVE